MCQYRAAAPRGGSAPTISRAAGMALTKSGQAREHRTTFSSMRCWSESSRPTVRAAAKRTGPFDEYICFAGDRSPERGKPEFANLPACRLRRVVYHRHASTSTAAARPSRSWACLPSPNRRDGKFEQDVGRTRWRKLRSVRAATLPQRQPGMPFLHPGADRDRAGAHRSL